MSHILKKYFPCNFARGGIKKSNVKIVFTPLHGTGGTIIPKVLSSLGFSDIIYVQEADEGRSIFLYVRKPNPEERRGS
jgi:phosphoglucomutase